MWLGKIALIMYVFSAMLLFSGYYLDYAFGLSMFTTVTVPSDGDTVTTKNTFDYLQELMAKHEVNAEPSIDLIFGDFMVAAQIIFGIITGDPIAAAFSALPYVNEIWYLPIQFIFTVSSVALWGYIIAGRIL
jgi:isopentenyl phosphate kinase